MTTVLVFATLALATAAALLYRHRAALQRRTLLLLAVSGWLAVLALLVALHGPRWPRLAPSHVAGDGFLAGIAVDPAELRVIADQAPALKKPDTGDIAAWREWQERTRQTLVERVFELDFSRSAGAPADSAESRESRDAGLRRIELGIPTDDGDSIPAVLLMPVTATPVPGILFIPGHVAVGESGLEQMVSAATSYHKSAARELARAGFATLTIELRGFGLRGPPRFPEHGLVAYNALLAGSFYKKIVMKDIKRAFDLLQSLPLVDPERLGISGVSLGGELAVEYAALDTRVKAISFHSHGGSVGRYPGESAPNGPQPHYCHIIPGVNTVMRQEDPFLLLAPRPTQGVRGAQQPFADTAFVETLTHAWTLMDQGGALELKVVSGETMNKGHVYYVADAIRFFETHLR